MEKQMEKPKVRAVIEFANGGGDMGVAEPVHEILKYNNQDYMKGFTIVTDCEDNMRRFVNISQIKTITPLEQHD